MKSAVSWVQRGAVTIILIIGLLVSLGGHAAAGPQFPDQQASGSIGLQGEISTAAPTRGATITTPSNGAIFTSLPVTVSGLCPTGLLVKLFANNVFVGSVFCATGSYSIQIDLFSGQNDLIARVYDALDQAGPDSNVVNVTFNDAQFLQFGTHITLTSSSAERGAPPGTELSWPILLTGGISPYAISVDWGDGSPTDLISLTAEGTFTIKHTFKTAGIYKLIIKGTDKNGGTAFLQLVAVATGAAQNNTKNGGSTSIIQVKVLWWPAVAMVPLIFAAFWVGRRHELYTLRKRLENTRDKEDAKAPK